MRKRWILCGLALLIAGLVLWRLWPRTIDSFIRKPGEEPGQVSCHLTVLGTEDDRAVYRGYDLSSKRGYAMAGEGSEEAGAVMEILRGGRYRASFTNLLPWTWGSLHSGGSYDGRQIIMNLMYDGEEPSAVTIIWYGNDKASVEGRQVDPIGNEAFAALVDYVLTHGELVEEE